MSHVPTGNKPYGVEPKVQASTAASYALTLAVTAVLNIVQDSDKGLLLGFLPDALEPFVLGLIPAAGAFLAGWLAKHQYRAPEGGLTP